MYFISIRCFMHAVSLPVAFSGNEVISSSYLYSFKFIINISLTCVCYSVSLSRVFHVVWFYIISSRNNTISFHSVLSLFFAVSTTNGKYRFSLTVVYLFLITCASIPVWSGEVMTISIHHRDKWQHTRMLISIVQCILSERTLFYGGWRRTPS